MVDKYHARGEVGSRRARLTPNRACKHWMDLDMIESHQEGESLTASELLKGLEGDATSEKGYIVAA